jgi:hypothetical protein
MGLIKKKNMYNAEGEKKPSQMKKGIKSSARGLPKSAECF